MRLALAALLVGVAFAADGTLAATLRVAASGVDGASCGTAAQPCRSIGQALVLAGAGDRIRVGPGRYGDLDRDGVLEPAAGEEGIDPACNCAVSIDKDVTIESELGADATFIEGGSQGDVVLLTAPGAVFGRARRGFTLGGGGAPVNLTACVRIDSPAEGARVEAIVCDAPVSFEFFVGATGATLVGNQALQGTLGFQLSMASAGATLLGNLARGAGTTGFNSESDRVRLERNRAELCGFGFELVGQDLVVASNSARRSAIGFDGSLSGTFSGNLADGNAMHGFHLKGDGLRVVGNLAVANGDTGFAFDDGDYEVVGNTAYSNAMAGISVAGAPFAATRNALADNGGCGLRNDSGAAIDAAGNYWGAASGPGPAPADDACNGPGATTTTAPFATKPFKVKARFN